MNTELHTVPLYPRARCQHNRATCMMQARKHMDAGRKSDALRWIGHALYWSTRARTGLSPDAAQDVARRRGKRYSARSTAMQALALAVAGKNPPGFVPASNVTGIVA